MELRDLYSFGPDRAGEIQTAVLAGAYVFSPLRLEVFPKDHPKTGFFHTFSVPEYPDIFFAVRPEEEDGLVFMALARMLNLKFLSSLVFIEKSFGLRKHKGFRDFDVEVVGWNKVETLFYLDLTTYLTTLSRSHLLAKLEPVLNDPPLLQFLSSFLKLPTLDEDGRDWSALVGAGVPSAGLLTSVLLNFYLDELDCAFIDRFPSFSYARYINEVFVTFPPNNREFLSRRSKPS